jgi:cyclic beta-1,2-glucan synthetase
MTVTNRDRRPTSDPPNFGPGGGRRTRPPVVPRARANGYVGAILGLGAVLLVGTAIAVHAATGAVTVALLVTVLAVPPLLNLSRELVDVLLYAVLPAPSPPPELELELEADGEFPASLATCVVYPVIVYEESDVEDVLATMLATRDQGGPGPMAHVALVDFIDNPTRYHDRDAALRQKIESRLAALNADQAGPPLAALYRDRRWNPVEQIWMGWERKRGKLMEFLDLVEEGPAAQTSFMLDGPADRALVQRLAGVRYLLTLDVGGRLAAGGVRRLVAFAAHPDHAAVVDEDRELVVSGYGLIRPHQATPAPQTFFSWANFGGPPAPPTPSVIQQLLGSDFFFGQGVMDVAAIRATVRSHIPENSVLSHDKLEAMHTGAACQTDVVLSDPAPDNYLTFRQRSHRWVRGDYHLVPWVFGRGDGPVPQGRRSLNLLGRWRLAEDLVGHTQYPATLAMLVLGWLVAPAPYVGFWTLAVLALVMQEVITEPLSFLVRRRQRTAGRAGRFINVTISVVLAAARRTMWVVLLADRALFTADAAIRALYRTLVSHRHVLQWTSFAHASRYTRTDRRAWWRQMWLGSAFALATGALVGVLNPTAWPWAAPLLVAWAVAPAVARWASRPRRWLAGPDS